MVKLTGSTTWLKTAIFIIGKHLLLSRLLLPHLLTSLFCHLLCRSWKYWHAPMNHAKCLAIVTAYDMYLEAAEGNLNPNWKVPKPLDFHRFREILGMQMMQYDPRQRRYPGDEKFRVSTQQNQAHRRRTSPSRSTSPARSIRSTSSGISEDNLASQDSSKRLCGFLDPLIEHQESVKRFPGHNQKVCVVCGVNSSKHCGKCGKAMHIDHGPKETDSNVSCFVHYHDTGFFGLARDDCQIVKRKQKDWTFPSQQQRKINTQQMKIIHKKHKDNCDNGTPNGSCS